MEADSSDDAAKLQITPQGSRVMNHKVYLKCELNLGALIITFCILRVPYHNYSKIDQAPLVLNKSFRDYKRC